MYGKICSKDSTNINGFEFFVLPKAYLLWHHIFHLIYAVVYWRIFKKKLFLAYGVDSTWLIYY